MKRRTFFKTAGLVTAGAAFANSIFANILLNQQSTVKIFPEDELKSALEAFFNKYFQGEMLDPVAELPEGKLFLSKSFRIETISEKNTIFDIADLVIKYCKEVGFDAGSLKEGIIPDKMKVLQGAVSFTTVDGILGFKIEELINYDAILISENPVFIRTKLSPNAWGDIKKIEKVKDTDYLELYRGSGNKITIKKPKKDIERKIAVTSLHPELIFAPGQTFEIPVSDEIGFSFFNEKARNILI